VVEQHQLGYVPELEVGAIASALEHCLTNPEKVKQMGDRARQLIFEQYTWDQIALNLSKVYTSILKQESIYC
jgi:glycosyltransferase involved in cell wall biosynthesis